VQVEIQRVQRNPDGPYAGVGHALQRRLELGVPPQDLTDIVRGIQARALFSFAPYGTALPPLKSSPRISPGAV
jgi:hypothetical protein